MRRGRWWMVAMVAAGLVASACGGDDGGGPDLSGDTIPLINDDPSAPTTSGDGLVSTTLPPGGDGPLPELDESAVVSIDDGAAPGEVRALVRSIEVSESVRYAGFGIEILTVDVGFDPAGFRVAEVAVRLTNDSLSADRLQTAVEIESAGSVFVIDRDLTPEVPAGGTGEGAFSLRLGENFTSADAVLFIGRPDRQRVSVPLGEAGELITRVPQEYEVPGAGEAGGHAIDVTKVVVGWDTADPRAQADPGTAFVTVHYVLDSPVATAVNDDTIALAHADGPAWAPTMVTNMAVEADTPTELRATFTVEEPVPEDLMLQYRERFGNGEVDVALTLG